ncbi:MAG: glycosyltransferase family 39 protein [Crocinitomicaceae bacterium]
MLSIPDRLKKVLFKFRFQLLLLVLWLIVRIIINPMGNFAINDDWAYAHDAQVLVEKKVFWFSYWPAMTLISQTFWGTLFCKIFGFSLFNLRMATMVLSILGSLTFFSLIKKVVINEKTSFLITVALLANPIYLGLSFTYMTELYYLSFTCFYLFFLAQFFRRDRLIDWGLACFFLILTVLVRQTGLILPIAFAFIYFLSKRLSIRTFLVAVLPFVIAFSSIEIYKILRAQVDPTLGNLSEIGDLFRSISNMSLAFSIERIGLIFMLVGLMLTPVSLLLLSQLKKVTYRRKIIHLSLLLIPVLLVMFSVWNRFPQGPILGNFELGPRLTKDVTLFSQNTAQPISGVIWGLLKCLSIFSISVLIIRTYSLFERDQEKSSTILDKVREHPFVCMIIVLFLFQCTYVVINPNFFDRYVLPMMFSGLILLAFLIKDVRLVHQKISVGITALFLIVSTLLVRDLFSWHRARQNCTNYLQFEMDISPSDIDGGFEYNGYLSVYGINPNPIKTTDKSWWFVNNDDYLITCGEFEGYERIRAVSANQLISTSSDSVYILRKIVD